MTITTIDSEYLDHPQLAATYLVEQGGRATFVETATAHSVPTMLKVLESRGLTPQQVDYIIITHVHLDHAGGAAALMNACPHATLLAHPRAARHVINPKRLIKSAQQVYGEERFAAMYGAIDPINAERVRTMDDEESLEWGNRTFTFLHTRGHANHHFCIVDSLSNSIFTGDAFGVVYPSIQHRGLLALPSTSPTDFDGLEAKQSIDRILATGASRAYLTHFGPVEKLEAVAAQLHPQLDQYSAIVDEADRAGLEGDSLNRFCAERVDTIMDNLLRDHHLNDPQSRAIVAIDRDLNAQGISFAVQKRRRIQRSN